MNIDELIHDLRGRINPQYYDQVGTESYERHQCVMAIEYLQQENERQRFDILAMNQSLDLMREENERLRKDAEVGAAIQRAAAELPARYIIGMSVEADAATVELCFPTGHIKTMDVDGDNRLAAEINAAIDAARGEK